MSTATPVTRKPRRRTPSTPEQNRRSNLKRLYGITPEQYDQMRAEQDYRCAICARHEDDLESKPLGRPRKDGLYVRDSRLVVDHCHDTGALRGLLCRPCNSAIGLLGESPERFKSALAYISRRQ